MSDAGQPHIRPQSAIRNDGFEITHVGDVIQKRLGKIARQLLSPQAITYCSPIGCSLIRSSTPFASRRRKMRLTHGR